MTYQDWQLEVRDRIATVTLNRPNKLNALSDAVITELTAVANEIAERSDIGGAVLTGAGTKAGMNAFLAKRPPTFRGR